MENWNMKSFSNETLNLFCRKFWDSLILDLPKTVWALRILSQKSTGKFGVKELWTQENHILVNMLLCSSYVTELHYVCIGTLLKNFNRSFLFLWRSCKTAIFNRFLKVAIFLSSSLLASSKLLCLYCIISKNT